MRTFSRTTLRALALPLADAARRSFDAPAVAAAADAVVLAALRLEDAVTGSRHAAGGLSAEATLLRATEDRLDARVRALGSALEALATLDVPGAEALADRLFPLPASRLTRARGRAQAPEFAQLAHAIAGTPAESIPAGLAPAVQSLGAELADFASRVVEKDALRSAADTTTDSAQHATEALREALRALDWQVQVAAGGTGSSTYLDWRRMAVGLQ